MTISTTVTHQCQVVTESIPSVHTAAVGIWLQNGARYESHQQTGFAHFMEHLLFKQTSRHSARDLSSRFEIMGGDINAETGRELTAFHGCVPDFFAVELLDLFIEMLTDTCFKQNDFDVERGVVLQELAMLNDDPEEALEDFATQQVFGSHSFGKQILGTRQTLTRASFEQMHAYIKDIVSADRMCIVAVGNVDHEKICLAAEALASAQGQALPDSKAPEFQTIKSRLDIHAEQRHAQWVMPATPYNDPDYACHEICNHILGGGYDSRLYQKLREQLGLVYSIDSRLDSYSDVGLWFIQTNSENENHQQLVEAVHSSIEELIKQGPTIDEVAFAKQHLQSSLILEQDNLGEKMERYAREMLYLGRITSVEEQLKDYDKVTVEDVPRVMKQAWDRAAFFTAG